MAYLKDAAMASSKTFSHETRITYSLLPAFSLKSANTVQNFCSRHGTHHYLQAAKHSSVWW
jgi:hypothetical protein